MTDLPSHKAHALDDGRLNNFAAGEATPRDSVGGVERGVRVQVTSLGDSVVGHGRVIGELRHDLLEVLWGTEEFEVGLLVDVAVTRAPAVNRVT